MKKKIAYWFIFVTLAVMALVLIFGLVMTLITEPNARLPFLGVFVFFSLLLWAMKIILE